MIIDNFGTLLRNGYVLTVGNKKNGYIKDTWKTNHGKEVGNYLFYEKNWNEGTLLVS